MGHRNHLHTDLERLPVPGIDHGLHPRYVFCWKLSNSLDTEFCLDALEMALDGSPKIAIFDSDTGCQFASTDFMPFLLAQKIRIGWSGRKRC